MRDSSDWLFWTGMFLMVAVLTIVFGTVFAILSIFQGPAKPARA